MKIHTCFVLMLVFALFISCGSNPVGQEEIERTISLEEALHSIIASQTDDDQSKPVQEPEEERAEAPEESGTAEYEGEIVVHGTSEGLYHIVGDPQGDHTWMELLYTPHYDIYEVINASVCEISYAYIEDGDESLRVSLRYPQFSGLPNAAVEAELNQMLYDIAYYSYDIMRETDGNVISSSTIDIEVKHANSEMISLYIVDQPVYYGGRGNRAQNYAINMNPHDGSVYTLMDFYLINEDFVRVLAGIHEDFDAFEEIIGSRAATIISSENRNRTSALMPHYSASDYAACYSTNAVFILASDYWYSIYGAYEVPYESLHQFTIDAE